MVDKYKEYHKQYYQRNKVKHRLSMDLWRQQNPGKLNYYARLRKIKHPEKALWLSAKHSATARDLGFSLLLSDISIPACCPYLRISFKERSLNKLYNPSIDRIDNTKGYHKDNIEIISLMANVMKTQATPEQLVLFAKEIFRRYPLA